jgi:hypothetical protein
MLGLDNMDFYRSGPGGEQTKSGLEYLKKESMSSAAGGKNAEDIIMDNESQDEV